MGAKVLEKKKKKYNLTSQITIFSPNDLLNYQILHSGPSNYQNFEKMPLLTKYLHNSHDTCHFSIKK
jgi:hypothetical protein